MTIQEMHYDFKKKLNKLDSNNNRNLLIPEIDWALNEALTVFIKHIASPRIRTNEGFEINQRITDDLFPLVVKDFEIPVIHNNVALPDDYMFYISSEVLMNKGNCSNIKATAIIQQQDDLFEKSPFSKSSFEWREVNAIFTSNGIKLYDDGTFTNSTFLLSYIKKHPYICYPKGFSNGMYKLPGKDKPLTENVDCILPEHTHSEIVDIAVALASGELNLPDVNLKYSKLQFNQFQ